MKLRDIGKQEFIEFSNSGDIIPISGNNGIKRRDILDFINRNIKPTNTIYLSYDKFNFNISIYEYISSIGNDNLAKWFKLDDLNDSHDVQHTSISKVNLIINLIKMFYTKIGGKAISLIVNKLIIKIILRNKLIILDSWEHEPNKKDLENLKQHNPELKYIIISKRGFRGLEFESEYHICYSSLNSIINVLTRKIIEKLDKNDCNDLERNNLESFKEKLSNINSLDYLKYKDFFEKQFLCFFSPRNLDYIIELIKEGKNPTIKSIYNYILRLLKNHGANQAFSYRSRDFKKRIDVVVTILDARGYLDLNKIKNDFVEDIKHFIDLLKKEFDIDTYENAYKFNNVKTIAFLRCFKLNQEENYNIDDEDDFHLLHFLNGYNILSNQIKDSKDDFEILESILNDDKKDEYIFSYEYQYDNTKEFIK